MSYPTGYDALCAIAQLMELSRSLDERVTVESTPAPAAPEHDIEVAAFFLLRLLRAEGVMYSLPDNSLGFATHKVLSRPAATRLGELNSALAVYRARYRPAAAPAPSVLHADDPPRSLAALVARLLAALLSNARLIPP